MTATTEGRAGWPSCDVVITTRNRPAALERALGGLANQSIDGFGVIVVDDCSEEPIVLADEIASTLPIEIVRLEQVSGPAAGRNAGVARSDAEFIVFLDDDVLPNRHFIEAHLTAAGAATPDGAPIVSCGPFLQPADWEPTPWNLWEARSIRKEAESMMRGVYGVTWRQFHTGNNCLPRDVFVAIGGFDESFKRAEDDELGLRLHNYGCRFQFEPDAIAWHYANRSLESWLAIPRLYAAYDVEIDAKYPEAGYLAAKKDELTRRKLPLRVARAVFGGERRSAIGIRLAVAFAQAFYRRGQVGPSMGALSVAYDLSYVTSMRRAETGIAA